MCVSKLISLCLRPSVFKADFDQICALSCYLLFCFTALFNSVLYCQILRKKLSRFGFNSRNSPVFLSFPHFSYHQFNEDLIYLFVCYLLFVFLFFFSSKWNPGYFFPTEFGIIWFRPVPTSDPENSRHFFLSIWLFVLLLIVWHYVFKNQQEGPGF